jgi:hypothetical protein
MAKIKIQIPTNLLNRAYPESIQLSYLPRKRKKKLKRELQEMIMKELVDFSQIVIDQYENN